MNTHGTLQTPPRTPDEDREAARASALFASWMLLLLLPFSAFAGFAAGHLPYVWFDREEGAAGPWWFNLLVGVIAVGITWLPVGASLLFGRRALLAGSRPAWVPVGIGLLLTGGATVLIVLSVLG